MNKKSLQIYWRPKQQIKNHYAYDFKGCEATAAP